MCALSLFRIILKTNKFCFVQSHRPNLFPKQSKKECKTILSNRLKGRAVHRWRRDKKAAKLKRFFLFMFLVVLGGRTQILLKRRFLFPFLLLHRRSSFHVKAFELFFLLIFLLCHPFNCFERDHKNLFNSGNPTKDRLQQNS